MGAFTFDMEVATQISPAKMFKAFVLDAEKLIVKVLPQAIKSVATLEGNGGPGTIRLISSATAGSELKYVKERIDEIDKENLTYTSTLIEGEALMNKLEKITSQFKFEASPDGGSICKCRSKCYVIGDNEVKPEEIHVGQQKTAGILKAFEAYLLANPDA